jgi:hypothetical protein
MFPRGPRYYSKGLRIHIISQEVFSCSHRWVSLLTSIIIIIITIVGGGGGSSSINKMLMHLKSL